MSLTDSQIQELIILQVGDVDASGNPTTASSGILATNIANIWSRYETLPARLRDLYVERDCINIVLGRVRGKAYDVVSGKVEARRSQLVKTLLDMQKAVSTRIKSVINSIQYTTVDGDSAIGQIETVTPVAAEDELTFLADIR